GDGAGISRFFRALNEVNYHGKVHATLPFKIIDDVSYLKFGSSFLTKSRTFEVQSYQFRVKGQSQFNGDPDYLFQEENIWTPETGTGTYVIGNYEPVNNFSSRQNVYAGFLMNELSVRKAKLVYGVRLEKSQMWYTGQNNDGSQIYRDTLTLNELNLLPSVNLIYHLMADDSTSRKMNLRMSYNHTLARPSFKEKSIAQIYDPITSRTFIGNINLKQTTITNLDLRYEYFMNRGELISVSVFHKLFNGHIELIPFETAPDNLKPRNSGRSTLTGIEVDLKKNLGFLSAKLTCLSISANVTLVQSKMDMTTIVVSNGSSAVESITEYDSRVMNARSGETIGKFRPMTGQSPYLLNGGINYERKKSGIVANVSYHVKGKTLSIVGVGLIPDVYTNSFHSLNLKVSKQFTGAKLSFKATNLLNQSKSSAYQSYSNETLNQSYFSLLHPGRTFSFSVTMNLKKRSLEKINP
ncbi:MAG: outer membrane beta-barrel protein, partial [Flavobacteriales bacterium]|nr:outer membrane beta-barrel protein [Flavobacteriales bacterium]